MPCFIAGGLGIGGGGGNGPPTQPPRYVKPTPASASESHIPRKKIKAEKSHVPEGQQQEQEGGQGQDEEEFEEENVGHEVSGSSSPMDESFVDPHAYQRGPRIISSSYSGSSSNMFRLSRMYPIQNPRLLDPDLPFHPSSTFIRREEATYENIDAARLQLNRNQDEIGRLEHNIRAYQTFEQFIAPTTERRNFFLRYCNAKPTRVFTLENIHPEQLDAIHQICQNTEERIATEMQTLRRQQNDLENENIHLNRRLSALHVANNYARYNPTHEFVVYLIGFDNIVQLTHPLTAPVQMPNFSNLPRALPLQPATASGPTPAPDLSAVKSERPKRSLREFPVLHLNHAYEIFKHLDNSSKIIVFPSEKTEVYKELLNFEISFKIYANLIDGWYIHHQHAASMEALRTTFLHFDTEIRTSQKNHNFKINLIQHLNKFIALQMEPTMKWYWSTEKSIMHVKSEIIKAKFQLENVKM